MLEACVFSQLFAVRGEYPRFGAVHVERFSLGVTILILVLVFCFSSLFSWSIRKPGQVAILRSLIAVWICPFPLDKRQRIRVSSIGDSLSSLLLKHSFKLLCLGVFATALLENERDRVGLCRASHVVEVIFVTRDATHDQKILNGDSIRVFHATRKFVFFTLIAQIEVLARI